MINIPQFVLQNWKTVEKKLCFLGYCELTTLEKLVLIEFMQVKWLFWERQNMDPLFRYEAVLYI